jgi:histone H3/H4
MSTEEPVQQAAEDDCEAVVHADVSVKTTSSRRKSAVPRRSKKAPRTTKTLVDGTKKKRRLRPGTGALREIRALQSTTNFLIPEAPMKRLIKEICQEQQSGIRIKKKAYEALHTAVESFIVDMFQDAMKLAVFAGRLQLSINDIRYVVEQYGMQMSKEYIDGLRRRSMGLPSK